MLNSYFNIVNFYNRLFQLFRFVFTLVQFFGCCCCSRILFKAHIYIYIHTYTYIYTYTHLIGRQYTLSPMADRFATVNCFLIAIFKSTTSSYWNDRKQTQITVRYRGFIFVCIAPGLYYCCHSPVCTSFRNHPQRNFNLLSPRYLYYSSCCTIREVIAYLLLLNHIPNYTSRWERRPNVIQT